MSENNEQGLVTTANSQVFMDDNNFVAQLIDETAAYSSYDFHNMDAATKAVYFTATNNTQHRIREVIGETIMVKDVYVSTVTIVDDETGEVRQAPRIILIDENGIGYAACSKGVFNSLKNLFQAYGFPPEWESPLPIIPRQVPKGKNLISTLSIGQIGESPKKVKK